MVEMTELFAVVGPAHQISLAASVAVIVTSVTRTITVTLTLVTRVLRSATPSVPVVPARTPLARFGLKWNAEIHWRSRFLWLGSWRLHAAVIFGMENVSKLFAVVVSTDQTSATLLIIVTIPLTLHAGVRGSTASPIVNIPALTSWRIRIVHNVK